MSGARLINQSTSGQTAIFNLGELDGVREGDFGVVLKEIKPLESQNLRIVPVAKIKNIKLNSHQSVWILYKIFDRNLLVKGENYLILTESHMLSGRRDPRFGRISLITDEDKAAFEIDQHMKSDKDRISKLKLHYPELEKIHDQKDKFDRDGKLIDVDKWSKEGKERSKVALYRSPYEQDFQKQIRLSTFEKLVTNYLRKVNDPDFNYESFYKDQMRDEFSNEFKNKSYVTNEYDDFISKQAQRAIDEAKLYRSILEKGESWSENFSDEELRVVLNQVSVLQEKDRKIKVRSAPNRYAAYLGSGFALSDEQTKNDQNYRRPRTFPIDFDFELIPILKHEILERFSIWGNFRLNKPAFEASGYNASVDETSYAFGLSWYPLYAAYEVEVPAFFIGSYLRSGTATVKVPSVGEKANYTVYSFPAFIGGMKFNFKNNVGLRIALSMETLQLERYQQSQFAPILPESTKFFEAKMNFSLAYSF